MSGLLAKARCCRYRVAAATAVAESVLLTQAHARSSQ